MVTAVMAITRVIVGMVAIMMAIARTIVIAPEYVQVPRVEKMIQRTHHFDGV